MQLIVFNNNNNPLYKLSFVALCFLVKCHTRAAVARAMIPHTPACAYAFTNNKTKQIYTITYYYTIHNITLLYVPWKSVNCVSYIYTERKINPPSSSTEIYIKKIIPYKNNSSAFSFSLSLSISHKCDFFFPIQKQINDLLKFKKSKKRIHALLL